MPINSTDTKGALLASLVPASLSVGGIALLAGDKELGAWWEKLKKPKCAPVDVRAYAAVDTATTMLLGPASYLVYKHGGGFDYSDTKVALGLYGLTLGSVLATFPLSKKRNLKGLFCNNIFLNASAVASAYAFYKIDKTAGLLFVPFALWTTFYTFLLHYMVKEESKTD